MILFIYGDDSYRSKEKLDEIISHYKEVRKSGLNLMYVDATTGTFADFYDRFKISPMFAETKLVILKNVSSSKQFQEDFLQEITILQTLKDVIVIFEKEKIDQRLKLFKTLLKECKCQEFALLDARQVTAWVGKELEKLGAKINKDALDILARYAGNDLWRLKQEIKKLADFKRGLVIKKEDVELMVAPNIENDIFKTIDALAEKNKTRALQLLHTHLDSGENALYLLSMVAYQFRNLLMVKELSEEGLMYASIIKKSGLHPFVVKKTYFQCRQFSFEELKNIYRRIFSVDADIKIGKIEPETALDLLISKM
ncbi:MAG: DNA polymerase III subunit delta [Candidatus Staskawiczbacteria bacterium RIFCSPHIGHO2_02_FULL_42_22]|uniref:DNA polymerase III subunit delta n=1 Tax=Candidatus Staskawiczbacteria bacterium RIFCSPHIGHO2_02_FULL_42_22 TaxID=1802207 RepID=A0A1G2I4D9_9BACT|nr:MAG: DNA polymerase III subunit delta [Candidatus Staskawiczbacteria bacterium RIFCSPHIGHO2_02_FULL_42_22]